MCSEIDREYRDKEIVCLCVERKRACVCRWIERKRDGESVCSEIESVFMCSEIERSRWRERERESVCV